MSNGRGKHLLPDRFWAKVNITDACWLWTGSKRAQGYGGFHLDGRMQSAHRVSYRALVGDIPDGLELDHLCRKTACVNPDHLEPVTRSENMLRALAIRTHCKQNHELTPDNLVKSARCRVCRTCRNEQVRRSKRKAKELKQ